MTSWRSLIIAAAFAALGVWLLLILRHPTDVIGYPDSVEYVEAAQTFLRTGGFPELSGRTPGYPLMLAAIFLFSDLENYAGVTLIQHLMLWACAPLLAWILYRATGRVWAVTAAGLIAGMNYFTLQFSPTLLSEVPAGFFFLLALALFQENFLTDRSHSPWLLAAAVATSIAMAMMRAAFFYLPFVFLIALPLGRWLLGRLGQQGRGEIPLPHRALAWYGGVAALVVLGWCLHNAIVFGTFGVTAILGGNLTNHTFPYIEDFEPESKQQQLIIAAIVLARDRNLGHGEMIVWTEMDVMRQATGLTKEQICRELMRINRRLILTHMGSYSRSVWRAWRSYWTQVTYSYAPPRLQDAINRPTGTPEKLFRAVNQHWLGAWWFRSLYEWKFLTAVLALMWLHRRRSGAFILFLIIGLAAWSEAAVSSFVEYGENFRYRAPLDPILIGIIIFAVAELIARAIEKLMKSRHDDSSDSTAAERVTHA